MAHDLREHRLPPGITLDDLAHDLRAPVGELAEMEEGTRPISGRVQLWLGLVNNPVIQRLGITPSTSERGR